MIIDTIKNKWPIVDIHAHTSCENPESADLMAEAAMEIGVRRIALLGDVIAFGYHPTE